MDGLDESGTPGVPHNDDIEVFTPSPDLNGVGTVTKLDGRRGTQGAAPTGELYPHMLLMPSGRTFVAGPNRNDSWFLNPFGAASTYTWTDAADPALDHYYGGGVIVPSDTPGSTQVELVGGAHGETTGDVTADATNEVFDEAAPAAGWRKAPSLSVARAHHNTVLLPDGSMVAVGGGLGEVADDLSRFTADQLSVDLFDPKTRAWHRGPSQQEARAYHSTALLLPDGRVISAGDDTNGGGQQSDTAEVYSPAYLFDGPRPEITGAPGTLAYGGGAQVAYAGSDVARAVLVAPGATTHANDMNQRFVPLSITGRGAGTVELAAPSGPTIAPPGVYMLFLLNARGVPSVARFVRVEAAGTPPVIVDPGPGGAGGGGSAGGGGAGSTGPATPPTGPQPALLTSGAPAKASIARVRTRGLSVPYACARGLQRPGGAHGRRATGAAHPDHALQGGAPRGGRAGLAALQGGRAPRDAHGPADGGGPPAHRLRPPGDLPAAAPGHGRRGRPPDRDAHGDPTTLRAARASERARTAGGRDRPPATSRSPPARRRRTGRRRGRRGSGWRGRASGCRPSGSRRARRPRRR
jgi:hypothetical protein